MLLLALSLLAHAAEAPTWTWSDGQVRRYGIEMHLQSPYVLYLLAERNNEVRVAEVMLAAVVACRREEAVRKGQELECEVEDVAVQATPLMADRGRAGPILQEYEETIEAGTIQARQTKDGRLRDIRLDGVPKNNDRQSFIHGVSLRFLERALAPLDLPLPEEDVAVGGTWKHKNPLAAQTPFTLTSIGSTRFVQTWTTRADGEARIDGQGTGMVAVADDRWDLAYRSAARFALLDGGLLDSHFRVVGTATPGSPITLGGQPLPYLLDARIQEIGADQRIELPPTGER